MLYSLSRILRGSIATCRHATRVQTERPFSVAHRCLSSQRRNYALPNATWSHHTKELYDKFLRLCKDGGWRPLPSYQVSTRNGIPSDTEKKTRLFTRNTDEDGVGFEYCMFYNKADMRTVCVFQPGPYLEGPPGYTHGGCIATIIDATVGTGAVLSCGWAMTGNLNINYRNPIPLGSTVMVDSRVEKVDGRKIYTSCQVRSHDDAVLHTEATVLFIRLTVEQYQDKI